MFAMVLVSTFALAACKRLSTGAKEEFATKHSCPEDRVSVKERSDIDPYTYFVPAGIDTPPADVAADPGRLAKWQADRKEHQERSSAGYRRSYTVFEISGCGLTVLSACTFADQSRSSGPNPVHVMCTEKPPK